jgi:ubiquinone/menaquinone biosynthesis C-methylase UbiE
MSDFDNAAPLYDEQFTHTTVGKAQRDQVWKVIKKIAPTKDSNVLEINCGTGEDADKWAQLGHSIHATDLSAGMIKTAQQKFPELTFSVLDAREIGSIGQSHDIIFSNFGGLNCLSPEELENFLSDSISAVTPNGKLILVIMGKKCTWDRVFMVLKRKWKERKRRNTNDFISVHVDGTQVKTWYYSPKDIRSMAQGKYRVTKQKPIGLFVPPSYLSGYFKRKKNLLSFLRFLDKWLSFPSLSNYSDHYLICLEHTAQQDKRS